MEVIWQLKCFFITLHSSYTILYYESFFLFQLIDNFPWAYQANRFWIVQDGAYEL